MNEIPVTYSDVAVNISQLSRELRQAASDHLLLRQKASRAKEAYTLAHAKVYLAVSTELDDNGKPLLAGVRDAKANLATSDERLSAALAADEVDAHTTYIYSLRTRIDAARSGGTLLRAEIEIDKVR